VIKSEERKTRLFRSVEAGRTKATDGRNSSPPTESVTRVLQECYSSVTGVLQDCYRSLTRALPKSQTVVIRATPRWVQEHTIDPKLFTASQDIEDVIMHKLDLLHEGYSVSRVSMVSVVNSDNRQVLLEE
jgi:hypothetical protein